MNKKEIYDEIECCIDELKRKDSEDKSEKEWVLLDVGPEEYLICDVCLKHLHREVVYIHDHNEQKKVLCADCWKGTIGVKE